MDTIQRVIAEGRSRYTGNTIDPTALGTEFAGIRERGYAVDNGEHQTIAAPIRAASGVVVAAISVSTICAGLPDAQKTA